MNAPTRLPSSNLSGDEWLEAYYLEKYERDGRLSAREEANLAAAQRRLIKHEFPEISRADEKRIRKAARELHIECGRMGIRDHKAFMSAVVGHEVTSFTDLTALERNAARQALLNPDALKSYA